MHAHTLEITDTDTNELRSQYQRLLHQLEQQYRLHPFYFDALKFAMQRVLSEQRALQDFWKQTKDHPEESYHLHLIYKDKELLNLPWQMAVNENIRISKGITVNTYFPEHTAKEGPLKVLVMISSPEDLDYRLRLSYEDEETNILKALAPLLENGQVQIDFTENGSLQNLQQHLESQYYHIFYFSGHGFYKDNTGYLLLENEETLNSQSVTALQLAQTIHKKPKHIPALIILASCKTAQGAVEEGFRGVTDELIRIGVPAVIAMAFSIEDEYAILFTTTLYSGLARKLSLPEAYTAALTVMRHKEKQSLNEHPAIQWLIPQLYLNRQVKQIVNWKESKTTVDRTPLPAEKDDHFIGRRRESARVYSELIHQRPVLITGQGGIGKTALAKHLVKRLIFHDSLYHSFVFQDKNMGIDAMINTLQQYLGTDLTQMENPLLQLSLLIKEVNIRCKPVWVFDNMESCQKEFDGPMVPAYNDWMQFVKQHLLLQSPVIFIGRYPVAELEHVYAISLNHVPFVDFYHKCFHLQIKHISDQYPELTVAGLAWLLYGLLEGNYRSLEFFNSLYVNDPKKIGGLVRQFELMKANANRDNNDDNAADVLHNLIHDSKELLFSELIKTIGTSEMETLILLYYFQIPVLQMALELQMPGKDFSPSLQRLKNLTLIEEEEKKISGQGNTVFKFYYITKVVRNWLLGVKMVKTAFRPELAGDYCRYCSSELTHTYGDIEEAFRFYEMISHAKKINEIGHQMTNRYYSQGLYEMTLDYCTRIENIAGDQTHEDVVNNKALAYMKYRKYDMALMYLERFLDIVRKNKNKKKENIALNSIGYLYTQTGDYEKSIEWLNKSLDMARSCGHAGDEAITLSNIGFLYKLLGEYNQALEMYGQSLIIRQELGDRSGEITLLDNISGVYHLQGNNESALSFLKGALSIAVEIKDQRKELALLNNIASMHRDDEKYDAALVCLQRGISIAQIIDDVEGEGEAYYTTGLVYKALDLNDQAIEYFNRGYEILRNMNYPNIEMNHTLHIGEVFLQKGEYESAIQLFLQALPAVRETQDDELEKDISMNMGEAYMSTEDFDNGLLYFERSLFLSQRTGNIEGQINAQTRIAQAYAVKNDLDSAMTVQKELLALVQSLGDAVQEALILNNIASILLVTKKYDEFLVYQEAAYSINVELNHVEGIYFCGVQWGKYLCTLDDPAAVEKGVLLLQQSYEIGLQKRGYPGLEEIRILISQNLYDEHS